MFGVCYYPEHWPQARWETDAKLMKEAGIGVVRLAEFSWVKLEPQEGEYQFDWLDQAMAVLAEQGIKVIMGTPTATPPKWLMDKHPHIYMEDEQGLVRGFGSRRHYCYNNAVYKQYSIKIVRAMLERYAKHPQIVAWQIDNEFTCGDNMYCYCEDCRLEFISWLQQRYGTLEQLNKAWGTVFWSQTYTQWNQIIVPKQSAAAMFNNNGHNPGLLLDYSRFSSDAIINYCALQSNLIRQHTEALVTHNIVMEMYDYYNIAPYVDVVSFDNYPKTPWGDFLGGKRSDQAAGLDLERGVKHQNFWVMEQQSGPCGWNVLGDTPKPGQLRLWTYQAMAHGAESIVYFRWRACLFGTEQYWYGILDHDGVPRRRYAEIKQIGEEYDRISPYIQHSSVSSDILMVRSFDQQWSHQYQEHQWDFDYKKFFRSFYAALYDQNYNVDIASVDTNFSSYKLVIAPAFNLMTDELKQKFERYVHEGGNLLITFRSGTKNWDNSMSEITLPGYFKELAGIELEEFDAMNSGRTVAVQSPYFKGRAAVWADIIKPTAAKVLAEYGEEFYQGKAAITVNAYGAGRCYYIGCDLDEAALAQLMHVISSESEVEPALAGAPAGVEIVRKKGADGEDLLFVMNHNGYAVKLALSSTYQDQITRQAHHSELMMEPYGVALLLKQ